MCCCLGCDDAFDLSSSELIAIARDALRDAIAHERSRCCSAGRNTHPAADETTPERGQPVARQFFPGLENDLRIDLRALACERQSLFHGQQNFADAEETNHSDQKIEAS